MIPFFVFDTDPIVRADVVDILEQACGCTALFVSESLTAFVEDLRSCSAQAVALVSGTRHDLAELFAYDLPKTNVAYVLYGQGQALPEQYVYSVVDRPFTNETMMQGISDALASLRSDR
ncbi:MAG: hypothetical protein KBT62_11765 [Sulfitobacter litoralis]|uniref:Response regulatory domain-containing protein n=2 Tax=root TaxID=1 RepID=A0A1H0KDU5_9RHOB|nr:MULTISPECIES: hypothetical protein [Sulfitobacter]MBQ0716255.1 hypothetical protein [Sulfitobacter litoralis]MBQ0767012.1 hypothetical protein [Sulfitobacter litoralis]MBQ0802602.1 hypothetical protein [Sulfitobacter litoralis]MCF7727463.1 hypothetical protein [Sulfitobacter sp. M22]MCF7778824.1 hypothetical protein [Sulfitobacter sp. M220]